MPIVTWSDDYNVNVSEIDEQHQKMLELVNRLHASVESCIEKDKLKVMLVELVEYTRQHFETEERLMKEYDFPDRTNHEHEHKTLLQHMDILLAAVSSGKNPTFYSDYDVSTDWMLVHINDCDHALGAFLNSKDVF